MLMEAKSSILLLLLKRLNHADASKSDTEAAKVCFSLKAANGATTSDVLKMAARVSVWPYFLTFAHISDRCFLLLLGLVTTCHFSTSFAVHGKISKALTESMRRRSMSLLF